MRIALALLVACGGSAPPPPPPPPAADPLAIVPASYQAVAWFARDEAPLYQYIQRFPDGPPRCIEPMIAASDGYVQAQLAGVPSLIAFHGTFDRDALEACLVELGTKVGWTVVPKREGQITVLSQSTSTMILGWMPGWVVMDHDRAVVEKVLAGKTHATENKELMALVARADHGKPMWMAGTLDYTGHLLGVPSIGFFLAFDMQPKEPRPAIVTIMFATPKDAELAAQKLTAIAFDPRFSESLQAQLVKIKPVATGAELALDIRPLFEKPALIGEMTKALNAAIATP
jgi:hypothetical protein